MRDSAIMARRIMHLSSIGTLSTVFPSTKSSSDAVLENRPSGPDGVPLGMMDYFADCEPDSGNPTILAITISSPFRNAAAGSNMSLSLRWEPPFTGLGRYYSPAAMPRFALIGHVEDMTEQEVDNRDILRCFSDRHPDALAWIPGNDIHSSKWVRLVVEHVYWFGGFGDRAFIGWIPADVWQNVTKEEIKSIRLPGEMY